MQRNLLDQRSPVALSPAMFVLAAVSGLGVAALGVFFLSLFLTYAGS